MSTCNNSSKVEAMNQKEHRDVYKGVGVGEEREGRNIINYSIISKIKKNHLNYIGYTWIFLVTSPYQGL